MLLHNGYMRGVCVAWFRMTIQSTNEGIDDWSYYTAQGTRIIPLEDR